MIGHPLPLSAGARRWGRNYGRDRRHASSWLEAGWRVDELRPRQRRVAFVPAGMPRPGPKPAYGRLAMHLRSRPERDLALTLADVEAILERRLPRSAWTDRGWWRNRPRRRRPRTGLARRWLAGLRGIHAQARRARMVYQEGWQLDFLEPSRITYGPFRCRSRGRFDLSLSPAADPP